MIIYKVMNNINGKIYIGQTSRGLSRRINHHIFTNRLPVARALNKYGLDKFTINVIDEAETRDDLNNKEKYWIQYYNCKTPCGYNCTDGGEGRSGFEVSKETRLKWVKEYYECQ